MFTSIEEALERASHKLNKLEAKENKTARDKQTIKELRNLLLVDKKGQDNA